MSVSQSVSQAVSQSVSVCLSVCLSVYVSPPSLSLSLYLSLSFSLCSLLLSLLSLSRFGLERQRRVWFSEHAQRIHHPQTSGRGRMKFSGADRQDVHFSHSHEIYGNWLVHHLEWMFFPSGQHGNRGVNLRDSICCVLLHVRTSA